MKVRLGFLVAIIFFLGMVGLGINFKNQTLIWYSYALIHACVLILVFREDQDNE
jgi:hypothetical protein